MIVRILNWRESQEEPSDINAPVLYCTAKSKLGVLKNTLCYINGDTSKPFSGWKKLVEKYNIKYWTYSNEITFNLKL